MYQKPWNQRPIQRIYIIKRKATYKHELFYKYYISMHLIVFNFWILLYKSRSCENCWILTEVTDFTLLSSLRIRRYTCCKVKGQSWNMHSDCCSTFKRNMSLVWIWESTTNSQYNNLISAFKMKVIPKVE